MATVYRFAAAAVSWAMVSGIAGASVLAVHEAQSLTQAKVSLADGIRLAEQLGNGHAVSASYEVPSSSPPFYAIHVLRGVGGQLTRYDLSPNTGKVQQAGDEHFDRLFGSLKPASIENVRTSLADAIQAAEARAGGKATDATIDRDGGQLNYKVDIARLDGSTQRVKVEGSDGTIAATE